MGGLSGEISGVLLLTQDHRATFFRLSFESLKASKLF